jgi:hypothetical protein
VSIVNLPSPLGFIYLLSSLVGVQVKDQELATSQPALRRIDEICTKKNERQHRLAPFPLPHRTMETSRVLMNSQVGVRVGKIGLWPC